LSTRKLLALALAAVAVVALLVAAGLKHVPAGSEALYVSGSGKTNLHRSGWHFTRPLSGKYILYPVGDLTVRYPRNGSTVVVLKNGGRAAVAFSFGLNIPPGSAEHLYRAFGDNFPSSLDKPLLDAIEIQAAKFAPGAGNETPDTLAAAVAEELRETFSNAHITLSSARIESWEPASADSAIAAADVAAAPPRKIVFIGVDAGDWQIIDPLIAAGKLPNFKRIVKGGATGPLRSMDPMLSPLLWTTMATGKLPEAHGVLSCTVIDSKSGKQIPITRTCRKVDAFWNMMSDYGRSVDVIGWLATYPAERINGAMVTDRIGYLAFAATLGQAEAPIPGAISPPERYDEISRLIVKSTDVPFADLKPFMHIEAPEFERAKAVQFDPENHVNNMVLIYATAMSFRNIALHLLEKDRPDFLGVYFELVDAAGHLFMPFMPPRMADVSDEDYRKYKDAITETYVLQDRIIGEILDKCDENTVVMITSDHGFKRGESRLTSNARITGGHAVQWHNPEGILCLYGAGVRRGYRIEGASIIDVTPTILALAGFPRVGDMPGKVLEQAFEPSLKGSLNAASVATLQRERGGESAAVPQGGAAEEAELKKLEALGYITLDNPDALNNLGQRYQKEGEIEKAIVEFKKSLALRPNHAGTLNNLGVCYGRLNRFKEAEETFMKALAVNPKDIFALNNLAVLNRQTGKLGQARRYAEKAIEIEPNYANGRYTLGSIYAMSGEFERAAKEFEVALRIEPGNPDFRSALELCRKKAGTRR
jgi:Tfp pilus assembly protein PilF